MRRSLEELLLWVSGIRWKRRPKWQQWPFLWLKRLGNKLALRGQIASYPRIAILVRRHAIPVTQPLVLISQIKRSGGTLLSQLFDGHPSCYAHPHELQIGKSKYQWPKLDLSAHPREIFHYLF